MTAQEIISLLDLKPLTGEGGYFRETYRDMETLPGTAFSKGFQNAKHLSTAIFYLLTPDTCSALHRLPADEVYHFYLGDPVNMLQLYPDGSSRMVTLGPDLAAGQQVQVIVPKDVWQGSFLKEGGSYALMGTTMAPGFDFSDFETGKRDELIRKYPTQKEFIRRLTDDHR
ncbi:MAG TPA: cupin domain-containing protein [Bacillota bacterium]|nr:cupin domain-containing protein [Bacillota bacterium]